MEASNPPPEQGTGAGKTAEKLVAKETEAAPPEASAGQPDGGARGADNRPLGFVLKGIDPSHPYLEGRGIARETAEEFGVGFFPGKGSMRGRLVIPIHNEKGDLVAYAGRSIDDSELRYKLPAGFKKSLVLYNLHRALKSGESGARVVIVEGFFDTMKVYQAGFSCVVGLMGSSLSSAQEELLVENFDQVVLMLDDDDAGRVATDDCLKRLARRLFVRAIVLPDGKQPDMLSAEEFEAILGGSKVQKGDNRE